MNQLYKETHQEVFLLILFPSNLLNFESTKTLEKHA